MRAPCYFPTSAPSRTLVTACAGPPPPPRTPIAVFSPFLFEQDSFGPPSIVPKVLQFAGGEISRPLKSTAVDVLHDISAASLMYTSHAMSSLPHLPHGGASGCGRV